MQKYNGICQQGGQKPVTGGLPSATTFAATFPGCTVTVYLTGTTTLATLFSDNGVTPLSNPFTASLTDASYGFYAADGQYDLKFTGAGIVGSVNIYAVWLLSSSGGGGGVNNANALFFTPAISADSMYLEPWMLDSHVDAQQWGVGAGCASVDCSTALALAVSSACMNGVARDLVLPPIQIITQHPFLNDCPNLKIKGTGNGTGNPAVEGLGGPQGTSIVASSTSFTNNTGFYLPYNWRVTGNTTPTTPILMLDSSTDMNGASFENITVNCNGRTYCSGMYKGHTNENSKFTNILAQDFDDFGLFVCGADDNGAEVNFTGTLTMGSAVVALTTFSSTFGVGGTITGTGVPTGTTVLAYTPGSSLTMSQSARIGGAQTLTAGYICTQHSGSQGDGPDTGLYLVARATAKALPLVLYGEGGYKGIREVTIAPASGGVVEWAGVIPAMNGGLVSALHIEGVELGGLSLGASSTSGMCPGGCNGIIQGTFTNINYTNPPGSTEPTVDVGNVSSSSFHEIGNNIGGAGCALRLTSPNYGFNGQCSNTYLGYAELAADENIHTNDTNFYWQFNQAVYVNGHALTINGPSPSIILQNLAGTGNPFETIGVDTSGDLTFTSTVGTGNWLDGHAYNVHEQYGNENQGNGLNTQAPLQVTSGVTINALWGSNFYFDASGVGHFGNIGGAGYGNFLGMQYGQACAATSNASQPGTVTLTAFLASITFCDLASGNSIFGSGASTQTDSGDRVQIVGSERLTGSLKTGTNSNTDLLAVVTLSGGTQTYTLAGTYTTGPECFSKDKTTPANANSCSCTTTVCTATGTGTDVITMLIIGHN